MFSVNFCMSLIHVLYPYSLEGSLRTEMFARQIRKFIFGESLHLNTISRIKYADKGKCQSKADTPM